MGLHKLRRNYEERKANLVEKLKKNKDELDLSTQHQIFGAIKEIDNFIKSIDYYNSLEAENSFELDLSKENEWPIMKRTKRVFRKLGNGTKQAVEWTFIKVPMKCGDHIKNKYSNYKKERELYKEIRAEIEQRKKA